MAVKPENIKWNPVNKSFRLPKFQKKEKSKFKKNLPKSIKNKTFLKGKKIEKVKLAFKKSRIKDEKAIITLNKKSYNNKQTSDFVNSSFSELIKSKDKISIQKFFDIYHDLFYNIPKKGEKSHESLIIQSKEYINDYIDWRDGKIEQLLDELESKEDELSRKQNPTTEEHIFYTNGTFLRTHGMDTEYVEGVPQGLPIWVMQEGARREFKNYDVYKIAKKAAGFTNMFYDPDKQELLGDKDSDILEVVHTTDLNYLPTGRDITNEGDLNLPAGPDLKLDISLSDILDYYSANLTCLEGYDDPNDPNQVKPTNYSVNHDGPENCYVRYWTLDGTRHTSRGFSPGSTIHAYFRKDNPDFDITDSTLGLNSNILQQQAAGEEDGIFDMRGYIRFDYDHPDNEPTKYVNIPLIEATSLPNYVEPIYSNYGTRMYQRYGYGDQRNTNRPYESLISEDLWEQVFEDPNNVIYNHSVSWDAAEKVDNVVGSKDGGYLGGEGGYRRNIYLWWSSDEERTYYVANVGTRNGSMFRAIRHYMVILNKDYRGYSPLSQNRVKMMKTKTANQFHSQTKLDLALEWTAARKFPQTEGGYFIPQEYWELYDLK